MSVKPVTALGAQEALSSWEKIEDRESSGSIGAMEEEASEGAGS